MLKKDFERIKHDAPALRRFAVRQGVNNLERLRDHEIIDLINDSICENDKYVAIHTSNCAICNND